MLTATDRRLLLVTAAVSGALVALTVLVAAPVRNVEEAATTYSVAPQGAKAAFLLLQRLRYDVQRWELPYDVLPSSGTLIIADPQRPATTDERARIAAFIAGGGRVIATGDDGGSYLRVHDSRANLAATDSPVTERALMPARITRAAQEITLVPRWNWIPSDNDAPLYGEPGSAHVVRYESGAGEALWMADPTPLTNAGLQDTGNLEFLLAAVGSADRPVLWDEFAHGHMTSAPERLNPAIAGMAVQLALVSCVVILTFSRRSGPIVMPPADSRLSPLEFVRTLGHLYRKAGAATVPLDAAWQQLRLLIAQRTGISASASADELAVAIRVRWQIADTEAGELLRVCETSRHDSSLTPSSALALTQKLSDLTRRLALGPEMSARPAAADAREESI